MTRDDVIRMATDANILEPLGYECPHRKSWRDDVVRGLERFAALVAAHEREECAKVAADGDHRVEGRGYYDQLGDARATAWNIENAIRARR